MTSTLSVQPELSFEEACLRIREGHPNLYNQASQLRDKRSGKTLTYSPKVFLPVTNLCRDRCSYCTFRKGPKDEGAHTMRLQEIAEVVRSGAPKAPAMANSASAHHFDGSKHTFRPDTRRFEVAILAISRFCAGSAEM